MHIYGVLFSAFDSYSAEFTENKIYIIITTLYQNTLNFLAEWTKIKTGKLVAFSSTSKLAMVYKHNTYLSNIYFFN